EARLRSPSFRRPLAGPLPNLRGILGTPALALGARLGGNAPRQLRVAFDWSFGWPLAAPVDQTGQLQELRERIADPGRVLSASRAPQRQAGGLVGEQPLGRAELVRTADRRAPLRDQCVEPRLSGGLGFAGRIATHAARERPTDDAVLFILLLGLLHFPQPGTWVLT